MKKILTLVLTIASAMQIGAQVINENYQDGKIWLKLKQVQPQDANSNGVVKKTAAVTSVKAIASLNDEVKVNSVELPFTVAKDARISSIYQISIDDPTKIDQALEVLNVLPGVEYAEKVPLCKTLGAPAPPPNDPYFSSQWELGKVNASQAWTFSAGSPSVVVAIIDDAIQTNIPSAHADLAYFVNSNDPINGVDDDGNGYLDDNKGYDIASRDPYPDAPTSQYNHGTQVAGVAAAKTNNGVGVASLGNGITILPIKAANAPNTITHGYEAILYAASMGADVICMAWGAPVTSITGQNIIDYAYSQGCVMVAGAGNDNQNSMYYPAAYNHVISVAATQSNDAKAAFSNYGTWVDVSAPGVNIYTTGINGNYTSASGTSISAAMVSGLAGLMLSFKPGLSPDDVANCIKNSATSIAAANPTFPGMLGTGRIDASATMGCITGTQYILPVADFNANHTTIKAGGKVVYANTSYHSPTSYSWTFDGGSPGTINALNANPIEVTYANTGFYTTTMIATNSNGSDTLIKSNYISVIPGSGCDTLNLFHTYKPTPWTPRNYYHGDDTVVGKWGWIMGVNKENQKEKAQFYDITGSPRDKLTKIQVIFGRANVRSGVSAAGKYIRFKVYEPTGTNVPGNLIGTSAPIPFQDIIDDVDSNLVTEYKFPTPLTIPGNSFFVSVAFLGDPGAGGNLDWDTDQDTLSIVCALDGDVNPTEIYQKHADDSWCRIDQSCGIGTTSWLLKSALYIFPYLTDEPVNATFTQDTNAVCDGNFVIFDATGSTYQDTLSWSFPGGYPSHSNKLRDTIMYYNTGANASVTYPVELIVRGGGCVYADTMTSAVTVYSEPIVSVSTNPQSICLGSGVTVSATASSSLATSYVWSPATGLSATTGATVSFTPTSSQAYQVTGTSAQGCESTTSVLIPTDTVPSAVAVVDSFACVNATVLHDASLSMNAYSYSWTTPGGTPSSATTPSFSATYLNAGTYSYTVQVYNNCGTGTVVDSIEIGCASIFELLNESNVKVFHNSYANSIDMFVYLDAKPSNRVVATLYNQLGQALVELPMNFGPGSNLRSMDVSGVAKGIYTLQLSDGDKHRFTKKVMIH